MARFGSRTGRLKVNEMDQEDRTVLTRRAAELGSGLVILAFGAIIMAGAVENDISWTDLGPSAGMFPFYVGLVIVLASLGVLAQTLLRRDNGETALLTLSQFRRICAFFLPILAYCVVAMGLGLYLASVLYLFAVMRWQGGYRVPLSLVVSVGTMAAFFVIFEWFFQMPLMKGPVESWLGIS